MPDRTKAPATRPFSHLYMPQPAVERLANGMTLHHYSGGDQDICSLMVKIPIGAEYTGNASPGILASQFTEGSQNLSPEKFAEALDFNGASMSARASGYFLTVTLNFLTDRLKAVMPLITDVLSGLRLVNERVENAKQSAVSNLLTARRNPAFVATEAIKPYIYGKDHPASIKRKPEEIMDVSTDELRTLFQKMLSPGKIHAMLSGRFSEADVETVKAELSKVKALSDGFDIPEFEMKPAEGGIRLITPFEDSMQSAIVMAIICPHRTHPDYIALRIAVMALGGYFGSRLMSNIREEKGLTYGIDASLQGLREGSFASISAKCDKRYTAEVESETIAEIRRLASDPPHGEELENLKLYAMTSLAKMLDNPMSIMGYYSGKLETAYPDNYFDEQQRVIKALTPELIAEMAARYLRPENIITSIAGE